MKRIAVAIVVAAVTGSPSVVLGAPADKAAGGSANGGGDSSDEPESGGDADAAASASASTSGTKSKKSSKKSAKKSEPKESKLPPPSGAMKGRVGVGAMRTLSGSNGLFVRGWLAQRVSLGLTFGVGTFTHRETDDNGDFERTRTAGRVGIGPEVFFWPVQGDMDQVVHADFGFGARVTTFFGWFGRDEDEQGNTLDNPLEIDVELPAKIMLWVGQRVAVTPEFGVVFRVVPGSREPDDNGEADTNPGRGLGSQFGTTDGPGFGFEFGDHGGLFMGIGFGYYFGGKKKT